MPLVNAKCTNCGANLQVDNTKDAAICQYCGSAYIVEKAINNYNTVNHINANIVNIYGGNSADFEIRAGVLLKYNGASTHVVVPNSVHRISKDAFRCTDIESVIIPDSISVIESETFQYCSRLKEVHIPNSVVKIEIRAFDYCLGLTSIYIPKSVEEIYYDEGGSDTGVNYSAFANCPNLTDVYFEDESAIKKFYRQFPNSTRVKEMLRLEEKERLEKLKKQQREWAKKGLCSHCGGTFKGLFSHKCSKCGIKKSY